MKNTLLGLFSCIGLLLIAFPSCNDRQDPAPQGIIVTGSGSGNGASTKNQNTFSVTGTTISNVIVTAIETQGFYSINGSAKGGYVVIQLHGGMPKASSTFTIISNEDTPRAGTASMLVHLDSSGKKSYRAMKGLIVATVVNGIVVLSYNNVQVFNKAENLHASAGGYLECY